MSPLYRFDFDEDTGKIERLQIDDYVLKEWVRGDEFYRFRIRQSMKNCSIKKDLDSYKHGRVYSFDPDVEHAMEIIKKHIILKKGKAHDEYEKYSKLMSKLEG